ncbi:PepSY-associated TM helix domain-containing protein [Rhodopila sp.]|uniref:PepSY-associated TM helix domain-containing protein n=1 Tax=Rhodopila sp. TaxID=2480087 RepID=UPI002D1D93F8|nr:PepSY-associated TM helix domain-containing protein [Rhodopila sp.]HVZ07815.1 PepSY-associated TM helix domain-containing protein [Rhodopila sp.]
MSARAIRLWAWTHKWTSLVCTLFLLMLCVTGLPLIFHEEIDGWLNDDPPYAEAGPDAAPAPLAPMVAQAQDRYPAETVISVFIDDDEPRVLVSMAPSWDAFMDAPRSRHWLAFDAHTGALRQDPGPGGGSRSGFIPFMLRLHEDLFAGLWGALFLGAMGLVFLAALVSGTVLYAPFMRRLRFGTIRIGWSPRLPWLDLHTLIGAVALAWMAVVGFTGALNEISTPLFALWQRGDVQAIVAPWRGQAAPSHAEVISPDTALRTAHEAMPEMRVISLVYPGGRIGSPFHVMAWAKGDTPLTSRLFSPALIDARTGALTAVVRMPWYLRALEVSRPLHFGDYGGWPLRLIWAALDGLTILLLVSGLYLWLSRGPRAGVRPSNAAAAPGETAAPGHQAAE